MLHIKFQASGGIGSKEEDIGIFFCLFVCFKPRIPLGWGQFATCDLHLNKLGKEQQGYIMNFMQLSQVVLKKMFFKYFSMYIYAASPVPTGLGPFWSPRPSFERVGKKSLRS